MPQQIKSNEQLHHTCVTQVGICSRVDQRSEQRFRAAAERPQQGTTLESGRQLAKPSQVLRAKEGGTRHDMDFYAPRCTEVV